jgi:hypothetical protein
MATLEIILSAIFVALNAADCWTTHRALATNPDAREANPFARLLIEHLGLGGMLASKMVVTTAAGWVMLYFGPWWVLAPFIAALAYITWNNTKAIRP